MLEEPATPDHGLPHVCNVTINAESEDDKSYEYKCPLPFTARIAVLVKKWAEAFRIPEDVVGLYDAQGEEIDTAKTPEMLSWPDAIQVNAYPKDEEYMELEQDMHHRPRGGTAPPTARTLAAALKKDQKVNQERPPDVKKEVLPMVKQEESKKVKAEPRSLQGSLSDASPASKRPKKDVLRKTSPAGGARSAVSPLYPPPATPLQGGAHVPATSLCGGDATPSVGAGEAMRPPAPTTPLCGGGTGFSTPLGQPPSTPVILGGTVQRTEATPASSSVRPKEKKAAILGDTSAGHGGKPASGGAPGPLPGFDDPIAFKQTNPKRAGSEAFKRYDKYKVATTIKQAMTLSAAKGDIDHDWKKGYFSRQ